MQGLAVVTAVRVELSYEEAKTLRDEIGQLELNGGTALEKLWVQIRHALDNTVYVVSQRDV